MIVPKKSLLVFGILSIFLFSGCGPTITSENSAQSQGFTLSDTKVSDNFGEGTTTTLGNTSTSLSQQPTDQTQKGTMPKGQKTVADFEKIEAKTVTLKTTKGDITFDIYTDTVPLTAANFLNLAKSGFYNGIVFHRVIPDFMAQVGDPLTKEPGMESQWGTGGPGYVIADEFDPSLKHDGPGVVSMANAGPGTGGSQFFITHEATPWLDGKHAVFGKVTTGMDVVLSITQGDKIISVSYQ
jgi:peptidyl-prolyl cis-trans isomerase B (cyclophilin B)